MTVEDLRRRSRWMMRALEWDDVRARYPNVWHEGMPRHVYALDTVARRLRLEDLIAIYYPASRKHPERADRFLGIARVSGLRRADREGFYWIDLETAHRFAKPLDLGQAPRRVFLCCDPGWPQPELDLFDKVWDAALAEGWDPGPEQPTGVATAARPAGAAAEHRREDARRAPTPAPKSVEARPAPAGAPAVLDVPPGTRLFGGVDYSGDMRDPRDATWLALVRLQGSALHVARLEPTGRHGLHAHLRDPDRLLMNVEAIGLDFPFGVPLPFAEKLLAGPFPDEGWWALARRLERLSRPDYLIALQEFRDAAGEPKRLTDEQVGGFSPLHRVNPDLGPMTYHGIRMIAEERSRYAIKPFETAQGRLLLEVYPGGLLRRLAIGAGDGGRASRKEAIIEAMEQLEYLPLVFDEPQRKQCLAKRDALDAAIAARLAAAAVLSGEAERPADSLAPEDGQRIRLEGWIYGLSTESVPAA